HPWGFKSPLAHSPSGLFQTLAPSLVWSPEARLPTPHHLVRRPPPHLLVGTPRPHRPRQPHPVVPPSPHPHPPPRMETHRHRHPPHLHPTRRHDPPQRPATPNPASSSRCG